MGVLADWQIRERVKSEGMIENFEEGLDRPGVVSYGLTSFGYDMRITDKFKIFTNVYGPVIDPKSFDPRAFVDFQGDTCIIPPNSFVLAESFEIFRVPRDILCVVLGKSTMARCGLIVNVTPLEPEWRGRVTIEISNTTPLPAKVYANEGIAQVLFIQAAVIGAYRAAKSVSAELRAQLLGGLRGNSPFAGETHGVCEWSYADKKGKYQDQVGVTLPFVKGT